jgi:hypothetical protein
MPKETLAKLLQGYHMPARSVWRPRSMNVLDPLQTFNNLGRSVSKASHMRVVAALQHVCRNAKRLMHDVVRSCLWEPGLAKHLAALPSGLKMEECFEKGQTQLIEYCLL